MAQSPLVSVDTLASWLGVTLDLGSPEETRAGTVLQVISGYAAAIAGKTDWDINTVPGDASAVILMVAVRCWVNPDGKSSVTIEDVTRRWESGTLFDDSEMKTLRRHRTSAGGLMSIQFTRGLDVQPIYTEVVGGSPVRLYDGRGY